MIQKALILGAFAIVVASLTGCPGGVHMSPCQKDEDCGEHDGGHNICYNLRCVECHYDADCPEGSVCGTKLTCESLDHRPKDEEAAPASLEECTKRCKSGDDACASACQEKFK